MQCLFDQQAAETRAIDKQVACELASVIKRDAGDETALPVQCDVGDLALLPHDTAAFRETAQEGGVAPRVQVIGVVDWRQVVPLEILGARELAELGGHRLEVEDLG